MEDINQRLETLPPKRQEQYQKVLTRETRRFSLKTETAKQEIIELTKSKILQYLANEEKEQLTPRKHGSKGKKHRERGPEQVKRIEKKLGENRVNYALLLKELFNVDLREKHSHKGIRYIGLCPFHPHEKTPSLSVNPDIGVIKCFGCGKGHRSVYLISDIFNVKYSRALGMLEKYIFTPEEDEDREKKNQIIRDIFQTTPEQIDRHDFARSRREKSAYYGEPPYLSKKKFNEEFVKRKEEQRLKEEELKNQPNGNDDLPF